MDVKTSKSDRRIIIRFLYEQYLIDPLKMLTPDDFLDTEKLTRESLAANSHYLHDRGYIELLVGYKPPLFAAARISPAGIDLVEDQNKFAEVLGHDAPVLDTVSTNAPRLVLQIAEEVEASGLSSVRKRWLLDDLRLLHDELRRPPKFRREAVAHECLRTIPDYFDEDVAAILPSFPKLQDYLAFGD
jgi:hypothetical protein